MICKATESQEKRDERAYGRSSRLPAPMALMAMGVALMLGACAQKRGDVPDDSTVLLQMEGKKLTLEDVVERIPAGIEPADSAELFRDIVDNWLETVVLSDMAESKLPDVAEIDRRVAEYRNRLIVDEYLRQMQEARNLKVNPDSIKAYYDLYHKELLTETPIVKGLYIKVPEATSGLDELRQLVFNGSEESIDRLEKNWLDEALQYDYFENRWIDWPTLASQIPYRFGDPDSFLNKSRNFETTSNGSTYLLHIYDYLPTGSEQPFDFASERIAAMLSQAKIADYEAELVKSLVNKAIKERRLSTPGYDLERHRTAMRSDLTEKKRSKDEK